MEKKRFFQVILSIAVIVFFLFPVKGFSQTLKNVPYDNPVYHFLDKAYAKSWIEVLHSARPYTEKKVYELLKEIESTYKSSPEKFLPLDIKELELNLKRIQGDKFSLFKTSSDNFSLELNLSPYITSNVSTGKLDGTATATALGSGISIDVTASKYLYLGLTSDVYLMLETGEGSPYSRFTPAHYPDFNMMTYNLTTGTDGFNNEGARSDGDTEFSIRMDQLNQVTIDAVIATITLGRNALSWGPSNFANMSLSKTAKPYEYITFDIPFGEKIYFTWMTGFLKDKTALRAAEDGKKLISAHRLEWQILDWLMVSIYETVVYDEKFELAYIIPFSLYYIAEVAQGDNDNKQAGIDLVFRVPRTVIYFSFFVDDWDFGQLFKASYYHNEMGVTLGARHYDLLPGLTISGEYTYLNQWMYTHKLVNGKRNNYTHYGSPLGHVVPPNSHIFYIDFRYDFSTSFTAGISGWFFQHGYGDASVHASDGPDWDISGAYDPWDDYYNYLDFGIDSIVKETAFDITLYGEYKIPYYGVKIFASWSTEYFYNKSWIDNSGKDENREGANEWRNSFSIGGKWQAY